MLGKKLGHYQIVEKIGAGGMGVVYKAADLHLDRFVALKVLPAEKVADQERKRRFTQEAKAASALNHPNIIHVYDIAADQEVDFIAMEYIEGVTLEQRINRRNLRLGDVLKYAVQIAEAVAKAHAAGIVHRDLKPSNIMVNQDGIVKILDFGLAKLTEQTGSDEFAATATADAEGPITERGAIIGTVAYMSPEQAEGRLVDGRSDIFSFGSVLYEMVTGRRAFQGESKISTLAAILHQEPSPVSEVSGGTPREMERIIARCLRKDPGRRFQHMDDLRVALAELKEESDSGKLTPPSAVPASPGIRHWLVPAGVVVVLLGVAAWLWFRSAQAPLSSPASYVQVTNFPDSVTQPALSPDGRMLTFIRGPNTFIGEGEIYVKILPNGEPVQLTNDGSRKMSPVFSPDGSRIAYTVLGERNSWDTWVVPVLKGKPDVWLPNAEGLSWIKENRLLFSEIKKGLHMGIVTSLESRTESRDLYLPAKEMGMAHRSYLSPDGSSVLVVEMNEKSAWMPCRLVPFDGSATGQPVGPANAACTSAAWSPDGKWMYLSANAGDNFHIWAQRFPNGKPEQLTSGATEEEGIAVAPDGRSLITAVGLRARPVWFHDASGDHQMSLEGYAVRPRLYLTGRKVCYLIRSVGSGRNGSEVWVGDLDSGRNEPLLPGFNGSAFDVSPDGSILVIRPGPEGKRQLWLGRLDRRSPPRQIVSADGDQALFGPMGDVFFIASEGNTKYLFRIREDGTDRRKVSTRPAYELHGISPDGAWVACLGPLSGEAGFCEFAYPTSGGDPVTISGLPGGARWAPDGKFLYLSVQAGYMGGGGSGRTYVLPTRPGSQLPDIPMGGFTSEAQLARVPGVRIIEAADVGPGPTPDVYVFSRESVQRNLFRVPLR